MNDSNKLPGDYNNFGVVLHGKADDLPANAVLLSPTDVYRVRKSQIRSWKNRSEIWSLLYGPGLSTAVVSISSFIANINAKQLFNLHGPKFFWSTAIPSVVFPAVTFWVAFEALVFRPILVKPPQASSGDGPCDVCLQVRAAATQIICGSILPAGLAFTSSSLAAVTGRTYPVPALTDFRSLFHVIRLYIRSFRISGPITLLLHTVLGSGITALMLDASRASLVYEKQMEGNVAIRAPLKPN